MVKKKESGNKKLSKQKKLPDYKEYNLRIKKAFPRKRYTEIKEFLIRLKDKTAPNNT
jgi:hypothetical protein